MLVRESSARGDFGRSAREINMPQTQAATWNDINSLRADLVRHFPEDRFLRKILKGAYRVGRDKSNPIRGNLVASGLREIVGHVLHNLAPDEEVRRCIWFEQATDTKTVTRRQRANYIVHAGLPDKFVEETLNLDVREHVQPLLDAMDALSKATHVRPETIVHKGRDVRRMMHDVFIGVLSLLDAAATSREEMKRAIAEVMHHAVFENLISDTIQELDELSTHTLIDGHYIDTVEVSEMGATQIAYVITGQVEVELQYGSDSDVRNDIGFRKNDSYPYSATITSNAKKPMEIHSGNVVLTVDNSSFFE